MSSRPAHVYPFTAIVGQDGLTQSLLFNAIDPRVGGVLIRGEKGTAKSTAVRALAAVLPELDAVKDCRFTCDPSEPASLCSECRDRRESGSLPRDKVRPRIVELPVSATEDRLVGTLDLEHALKHGERRFEPGLLGSANRQILYIDEVNLLDDHLVDTLLDAAAMGVNTIEREGISFCHPARFILIGTMNPEEGDLRPQLLDRFGLCVDVGSIREPASRVEIMNRRRSFEEDPGAFTREWLDAEDELRVALKHARLRLPSVTLSDDITLSIASLCSAAGVDGHRADLVMARASAARAALDARSEVLFEDVEAVAPLVLTHRIRLQYREAQVSCAGPVQALLDAARQAAQGDPDTTPDGTEGDHGVSDGIEPAMAGAPTADLEEALSSLNAAFEPAMDRARRSIAGRRHETASDDGRGRFTRSEIPRPRNAMTDIALDATIRAAAPHQAQRQSELAVAIEPCDIRTKVRTRKVGASIVFCVDSSGSMGTSKRMDAAKAAIVDLLVDAYQRRDRVGLISFRGDSADLILAPTGSVELAQLKLREIPTGGATPLAAGIVRGIEVLEAELRREPQTIPWLVLVTDGRANVGLNGGIGSEDARAAATRLRSLNMNVVVIDTAGGNVSATSAREIARTAGGEYVRLDSLTGASVAEAVRARVTNR